MSDDWTPPRRCRLDQNTTEELALYEMLQMVERMPPHPLLTEASILIIKAREKVADYVDLELSKKAGGT